MRRAALLALLLAGCPERRRPITVKGDAGPAVVVVEPVTHRPQTPLQQVPLIDEKEPDDDVAHAQPLESGKGIKGTLLAAHMVKGKPASDEDVYSWTEGGSSSGDGGVGFHEARISLGGIAGVDLVLEALDGDGKRLTLANEAGAGEGEVIPNLAVEPGHTYYVRVKAGGVPPAVQSAPYQLVVQSQAAPPGAEREPNDDSGHATLLDGMAEATGYFGRRRDEDWLKLPVHLPDGQKGEERGGIVRVELGPVDGVAPQLKIFNGADLLASARGTKGDELRLRNVGVPPGATALLVWIKAAEGKNLDARWLLKMGVEPPLDGAEKEPNDSVDKANPATVGQTISGFLWAGDQDVYCLPEDAANLVRISVEGLEGVDLKLDRMGRDGKVSAHADDGGPGKPETLSPSTGGCVRVSARTRDVAFDAPYRLSFTALPATPDLEREPNDSAPLATRWPDGQPTMRGWLAPRGDEDWFRFSAPAGKSKVTATVEGATPMVLKLTDESKAPLGPSTGTTSASGPVQAGKSYFVSLKAKSDRAADATNLYTITLNFE